ncbi:alanine--tRNA ligase [Patescibacteria group bacterium]|nr:alanine--tRNA ligase [Patescibacteria group bacterium]
MKSFQIRQGFLIFFKKRTHKIVSSSSLLPSDPSVLFTTAGMQQFKEYYLGEPSPYGKKVASCQKCFRTSDIEEVGDNRHLTFLEMLGNFSFGDYFKEKAVEFALEVLTKNFKIPVEKLWITYFGGEGNVPEDKESQEIWKKLGVPQDRIYKFGKKDNFWGPTGLEGPCGPTTEIHYDLTKKPCELGKNCLPNCQCGRFIELWNLVFNEYYQDKNGKLSPLKQKGVDTGMGLERLAMVLQQKESIFETDLFSPIILEIGKMVGMKEISGPSSFERLFKPSIVLEEELTKMKYQRDSRIIADHIKASVFLIAEEIFPSNVEKGYVLRRILRRAIRFGKLLNLPKNFLIPLAQKVVEIYKNVYPEIQSNQTDILTVIQNEGEKFEKTLEKGLKQFEKILAKGDISGIDAFHLFDTYGFPLELTQELAKEKGLRVDVEGFKAAFKRHREISRAGAEKKFGGIGKSASYEAIKLHTATHLLHWALREVLGKHVKQMGSDINSKRLRFDFSHPQKPSEEEIKKVEDLVNQKIKEDLVIEKEEMEYERALESGALAFFREKYPKIVTVYSIGNFSKEICAGPHINETSELGFFKIIKEESSGAGIRRIRAILK